MKKDEETVFMQKWIEIIHRLRTEVQGSNMSPLTSFLKERPISYYRYKHTTSRLQPIRCDNRIIFTDRERISLEVGYICFVIVDARELYIDYFEVEEPFRGMGYGKEMYKWVEAYAKRRGVDRIFLTPYNSAIEFWKKLGFGYRFRETFEMTKTLR